MITKPDYVPEMKSDSVSESTLKEMAGMVKRIAKNQEKLAKADKKVKDIKTEIQTEKELLSDSMETSGLMQFTTSDGTKARVLEHIGTKIIDPLALYENLKERGEQSILKVAISGSHFDDFRQYLVERGTDYDREGDVDVTCHHKRLSAYVREREEDEIPGLKISRSTSVSVK